MFLFSFLSTASSTSAIYSLSLHDALPIYHRMRGAAHRRARSTRRPLRSAGSRTARAGRLAQTDAGGDLLRFARAVQRAQRSEEHTSELQSLRHLVCRLLLEKKKTNHPRFD